MEILVGNVSDAVLESGTLQSLREATYGFNYDARHDDLGSGRVVVGGVALCCQRSCDAQGGAEREGQFGEALHGRLHEWVDLGPPNGSRLSCGAPAELSQMQFYREENAPPASSAC